MLFAGSFHLPHSQRDDCEDVWQLTVQELHDSMRRTRHQDHVLLGIDANLELCMPCDGSVSSACLRSFVHTFGLAAAQGVHEHISHLLGVDHALVFATIATTKVVKRHRRKRPSRCGKWSVRLGDALQGCSQTAQSSTSLDMEMIEHLATKVSFRPQSFRYRDPPEIKDLIRRRRECSDHGHAKELALEIVGLRRAHKQAWLATVLERARSGDFQAITCMKRRQSMGHTHCSYLMRAGGEEQALKDLRSFYVAKYLSPRPLDSELAFRMVWCHQGLHS